MGFQVRAMMKAAIPQKVETKAEVKMEVEIPDIDTEKLLGDIASAIADNYLDSEARRLRNNDDISHGPDKDFEGGLDSQETASRDG